MPPRVRVSPVARGSRRGDLRGERLIGDREVGDLGVSLLSDGGRAIVGGRVVAGGNASGAAAKLSGGEGDGVPARLVRDAV